MNKIEFIPKRWIRINIVSTENQHFIYGYHHNNEQGWYCIIITDFKNVWKEFLDKKDIITKAASYGVEDLSNVQLNYLLDRMKSTSEQATESKFQFQKDGDDVRGIILFEIDVGFPWAVKLHKVELPDVVDVLAAINYQQFGIHDYMRYKIEELEKIINSKDRYTTYLEENYKTLNGDELIRKYKNSILDYPHHLDNYRNTETSEKIKRSYERKMARVIKATPKCSSFPQNFIWNSVERAVGDSYWDPVDHIMSQEEARPSRLIKKEPEQEIKESDDEIIKVKKEPSLPNLDARPLYLRKIGTFRHPKKRKYNTKNEG